MGADLVYYDNTYRSHVMVQYKMMTTEEWKRENEKDENGKKKKRKEKKEDKLYYYSPTTQFYGQIERMRSLLATVSGSKTGPTETNDYRLDSNWFYFKLCEPYEFKPVSPDSEASSPCGWRTLPSLSGSISYSHLLCDSASFYDRTRMGREKKAVGSSSRVAVACTAIRLISDQKAMQIQGSVWTKVS